MEKEYAIGIDLGGTSVKYALIDNEGVFYFQGKLPSKADVSAEAVIGQLVTAINEVKAFAQEKDYKIDGIGIGTPGIVDCTNRIVLGGAENINGWENIHLADRIETETGLPALLGNDANLMGLGETMYGAGQGATHVVFLTVGTGIGGAVVIDGKLFNGYANRGTELGHVPLIANGEPCACGSVGCLEHYASTSALVRRFSQRIIDAGISYPNEEINGELIVRLYKQGDSIAKISLEEHCDFLEYAEAPVPAIPFAKFTAPVHCIEIRIEYAFVVFANHQFAFRMIDIFVVQRVFLINVDFALRFTEFLA